MNEERIESLLVSVNRWMWLVVIFLLIGGGLEFLAFRREQDKQEVALYQGCLRAETIRALAVNFNGARQHDEDLLIADVLVQSSLLRSLSPHDREQRVAASLALRRFASALAGAAPIDCKRAVYSPPYKPPNPVPLGPRPVLPFFPSGF